MHRRADVSKISIINGTRSNAVEMSAFLRKILPGGTCLCESSTTFNCGSVLEAFSGSPSNAGSSSESDWQFQFGKDDGNIGLTPKQCNSAFPGLFEDINRAIRTYRGRPVLAAELNQIALSRGMVRAMIFNGKLHILEANLYDSDHRKKGVAILQSIYRSISIIPDRRQIPNISFIFTVDDMAEHPSQPLWALARRPQDENLWLMPDFGFWSWDLRDLGPFDKVVEQMIHNEKENGSWGNKIPKLFWRGHLPMAPKLRRELVAVTRGKSWSDVEPVVPAWRNRSQLEGGNFIGAADQCEYMFIAHVEGRSYSGSLKYRQVCHSAVIIHKLQWIQHYHYLLVSDGLQQNFIEVERDFSDLEKVIEYYLANLAEAERIASNSVKTFRERYLTQAAEACYWRALIEGWAEVNVELDGPGEWGMRFENFVLLDSDQQLNFGRQVA